jgi:hypothetical protein
MDGDDGDHQFTDRVCSIWVSSSCSSAQIGATRQAQALVRDDPDLPAVMQARQDGVVPLPGFGFHLCCGTKLWILICDSRNAASRSSGNST